MHKVKESREAPYNTNIESKGEKSKEDFYNQGNVLQPPELEEVREYARQNGLSCNPDAFYRYYQAHDWMDKKGMLSGTGKGLLSHGTNGNGSMSDGR